MHRFLEVWDFNELSVESTINFVLNEGFVSDDYLREDLIKLAQNFLNSDLRQRITKSKRLHREVPYYIEIDGTPERGRIDLILEEDDGPALFDYKFISGEKELMELKHQLERYGKVLEKRFGIAPNERFFVVLPEVKLLPI